ncbi:hypothetical protein SEVIR_5G114600v4 [Setaria viridis]|uniref:NAB domain-containing protein n=3 Tax=Setaria TaxID=4554 RepID=K3XI82_SETIT|nr:protein NETWORKED 4B isoform X2 [Setaria italica]XP_012702000.1 protein NETWORKED 4B isoform X2 [Setaria italica]XP_012702001.1 protein NETWORKED 4B isoform X2 [Setaria italica]XP_022682802.1 protein NETWORKED 4B isoform X2 [Setaria italica]XP_022682803.1 protein NETWORKED 4B isoform X2 [Setaria italica]XP_034597570.1 protein NETWORKED 4B-like isoform X2 [Setaria viridis]XP_034597571.1 protein NETWORKED 4B-like isoform X2 [Setaria viridis]XP_034597572.1 protein NETWORKED 4B-like isoform X
MKPPLERNPTKKRHSWWWDSHISPKNSKWLAENLEEMDKQVKEMLQLIEEDGDSFAKKAQMYYQKRPMLITHVENFYRMYRALAERYDNVTGELRKNIPTRLQSTGSLASSECGSEFQRSPSPSPEPLQRSWTREQSPRAAGFDFFLSNKNNDSPASRKEPEDLASQSESDAKSEDGEDDGIAYTLHQRVLELEDELNMTNQKLRDADEKLEVLEEKSLMCHCDYKENGNATDQTKKVSDIEGLSKENSNLLEQNTKLEAEIIKLKEEVDSARRQFEEELSEREREISRLKQDLADASEKLLQEKSINGARISDLQKSIEDIRSKLERVSEEKLLVEKQVKELEEANTEAEKYSQELTEGAERLSEEKFKHEAEILTMQQSIEDLKSRIESLAQEKSLMTSWFADLEQVVGRGRSIFAE